MVVVGGWELTAGWGENERTGVYLIATVPNLYLGPK